MGMKKQLNLLVIAQAINLALSSVSFAGPWPALETDKQKLEYGLALRNKIPNFFTGTFNYGMEWWRITEDQAKVKRAIEGLYPASLDTAPLAVITLNRQGEKQIPSQAQFELFKLALATKAASLPTNYTKQQLAADVVKCLQTLQTIRPGELLNQLLHSVPADLRDKTIMKAQIDE
jgi:hypothetical protein